jgi:hypothetical protein
MAAKVTKYVSRQLKNLLGNYVDGGIPPRFSLCSELSLQTPPRPCLPCFEKDSELEEGLPIGLLVCDDVSVVLTGEFCHSEFLLMASFMAISRPETEKVKSLYTSLPLFRCHRRVPQPPAVGGQDEAEESFDPGDGVCGARAPSQGVG